MKKEYLVEVEGTQLVELVAWFSVEAENEQEAKELVMAGKGLCEDDSPQCHGDIEVKAVRFVEEVEVEDET